MLRPALILALTLLALEAGAQSPASVTPPQPDAELSGGQTPANNESTSFFTPKTEEDIAAMARADDLGGSEE